MTIGCHTMTRKHFQQIANAMQSLRKFEVNDAELSEDVRVVRYSSVVDALAKVLAESNPKFDRDRFLDACGIGPSTPSPIAEALAAIEREDTVCFDVAAEHGQM